jgi:hypothetical protein
MKAEVTYNDSQKVINVNITNNDRTLNDIEQTARIVKVFQEEFDCNKLFYDHSDFPWRFDYLNEYKLAKDFNTFLPFNSNTKMAFYLGKYYDEKYWDLMRKLIRENSKITIEYFGNREEAEKWLLEN